MRPTFGWASTGGATPLSKSGIGYAGLAEADGAHRRCAGHGADRDDLGTDTLLIVTISPDSDPAALDRILERRQDLPTLFVLPKWQTIPLQAHEGWEMKFGRLSRDVVDRWLGRIADAKHRRGQSKATGNSTSRARRGRSRRVAMGRRDGMPVIAAGTARPC